MVEKRIFGVSKKGKEVALFHLENESGAYVAIMEYGWRIHKLRVPDRDGKLRDVVLGYDTFAEYEADKTSQGAAVGRHANRIAEASFVINDVTYPVEVNDGKNHLHGGAVGFSFRHWEGRAGQDSVTFRKLFPHMEGGYPGNLAVAITYVWTKDNCLEIIYEALSDADTVFNVTNHSYFNLDGWCSDSVLNQELTIFAETMTENNAECIPTGVILPVEGTPFDFRTPKAIGKDIETDCVQLKNGKGYDHNFILDGDGMKKAAQLYSKESGILMTCYTDQPGIQIYTSNMTDFVGKSGKAHKPRCSVCLETQHFPNATNIKEFPSVVIRKNEPFTTQTNYEFQVK